VLDIYFVEHVKKTPNHEAVDDFLVEICKYTLENGDVRKAAALLERVIAHTNNKRPEIADMLAASYEQLGIFSNAYRYYFKAVNEKKVLVCLLKVAQEGYETELDLFFTRACLDMLLRSTDLKKVRYLHDNAKSHCGASPLLNFVEWLIECIEAKDFELAKKMIEDYATVLRRDVAFEGKLDAVCQRAFGQSIKPPNPMQAMMAQMMGGGKK